MKVRDNMAVEEISTEGPRIETTKSPEGYGAALAKEGYKGAQQAIWGTAPGRSQLTHENTMSMAVKTLYSDTNCKLHVFFKINIKTT